MTAIHARQLPCFAGDPVQPRTEVGRGHVLARYLSRLIRLRALVINDRKVVCSTARKSLGGIRDAPTQSPTPAERTTGGPLRALLSASRISLASNSPVTSLDGPQETTEPLYLHQVSHAITTRDKPSDPHSTPLWATADAPTPALAHAVTSRRIKTTIATSTAAAT